MNEMIKTVKEIHKEDVCLFKIGAFYHSYNRDCYILSFLFNYKIKSLSASNKECGFPEMALNKVIAKLEQKQINYLIIDRRNNYDVDRQEDFKNLNKYSKFYEQAKKHINLKKRVEILTNYLDEVIEKEDAPQILSRMEEIMYES